MSITIITALYDIGRSKWSSPHFSRSYDNYIASFLPYLNYNFDMVIFIDDKFYSVLDGFIKKSKYPHNKKLIPINEDWMKKNIWAWSKLERERQIMNSEEYKSLLTPFRLNDEYPEYTKPEYTIMTHSKIDFVNYAIDNSLANSDFYMWTDFGYFFNKNNDKYLPKEKLDSSNLDENSVNLCCIFPIDEKDRDIIYTLKEAPAKIGAYLFAGKKDKLKQFQNLCHKYLDYFQSINIADDEQSLWLQCYFEKPELFKLHVFNEWHIGLKYFSK